MASMMCPLRALQDMRAIRLGIRGNSLPRAYLRSLTSTATSHHPPQRHSGARSASPLPSARATIPRETRILSRAASFHSSPAGGLRKRAHNDEEIPDSAPTTDFTRMDMLGTAPVPSTSVDICSSDGFKLNSGVSVYDGKGLLLVDGEAFEWQPWGPDKRLVNTKGQWEVPEGAFGVLDLLWPRPGMFYTLRYGSTCRWTPGAAESCG